MVVAWKEQCNKLLFGSTRDGERQRFIGRPSVWKDGERMRNVSEVTTCIATGQRNRRWILIEPFQRQRRNATVAKRKWDSRAWTKESERVGRGSKTNNTT
ncbi:hypothetical protein E5676_scaffold150G00360 [Cucumis melo var. makuwa]|uniref:Uncharacterized protein n=1 Tax=Cucumis melo var. makuwa TaxID=1194695 RepID=A0A5A7V057_CUCMM|nr:hypothetical protein E6C27_scaffold430G00400 [Cucumis melo var. makuwa]TYK21636.1 hypothetical protein E5676_scaffold150G00360 [Cucumis melo var. makuwa]